MKGLVQWTYATPSDWEEFDSSQWGRLPSKPEPVGGERLDTSPGWVFALNFQGVILKGWDHYHVEHVGGDTHHVRVTCWNDDADDHPIGTRHATVWDILCHAPDPTWGGAINTRQTKTIYAENGYARSNLGSQPYQAWTSFVPPKSDIRHGIWVPDPDAFDNAQTNRGWREWTEGLDLSELDANGQVKPQRREKADPNDPRYLIPDGTKTFYHNSTDLVTGVHSVTASNANELGNTPVGVTTEQSGNVIPTGDALVFVATTGSVEPNETPWPTGNYRAQLDVPTVGGDLTFGLLTLGASAGHFARVNTGLTSDLETKAQAESAFFGTGLHLATTGSVSWSSGATADRFEILIAAANAASHGNQKLSLDLGETDDFVDGPWTSAAVVNDVMFFGMNF